MYVLDHIFILQLLTFLLGKKEMLLHFVSSVLYLMSKCLLKPTNGTIVTIKLYIIL